MMRLINKILDNYFPVIDYETQSVGKRYRWTDNNGYYLCELVNEKRFVPTHLRIINEWKDILTKFCEDDYIHKTGMPPRTITPFFNTKNNRVRIQANTIFYLFKISSSSKYPVRQLITFIANNPQRITKEDKRCVNAILTNIKIKGDNI